MNKLIILLVFFAQTIQAQTTIPSSNVSGTWTKANSPYLVQGEITITKGNSLTIEPGTVVQFAGEFGMTVDGVLNAIGTQKDTIVFTSVPTYAWLGIVYYRNTQADSIKFKYCKWVNVIEKRRKYHNVTDFEWQPFNILVSKALFCAYSSPLVVENCAFDFNIKRARQTNLILNFKSYVKLNNLYIISSSDTIANSGDMLEIDSCNRFDISNIKFKNIIARGSALTISNSIPQSNTFNYISHFSIENSAKLVGFYLMNSRNIVVSDIDINVSLIGFGVQNSTKCKLSNIRILNTNTAIGSSGNCTGSIIENCYLENCGSLINSYYTFAMNIQSSGLLFYNCEFKNNKTGLEVGQNNGSGTPIFLNCQFSGFQSYGCFIEGYPVFVNCNFQDNYNYKYWPRTTDLSRPYAGAITVIREQYNSRPYFYNCLLWGNKDSFGHYNSIVLVDKVVKADLNYCLVQGDSSNGVAGLNDADRTSFRPTSPQLTYNHSSGITPGFEDSTTGNYQLLNTCTKMGGAVNKGMRGNLLTQYPFNILNNTYGINIYNATDLAGNPRVVDDTLDIGCYESQGNKRVLKVQSSISDTSICYGANLSVQSKTNGYVQNYIWQEKQGSTITNVSNSKTLNLVNAKAKNNQYRLVLSSTACLPLKDSSNWFTVQVKNPIKKGIVKNPNKDSIQLNETMLLSTGATGYNSFAWSNGASTSSTSFKGSDLGSLGAHQITLEARNINGCLETDTVYIYTKANSSIHQSLNQAGIKLYPSPANTILNIECNEPLSIEIYDLNGQLLFSQNTESNTGQLNIEELKQGVYFVKLRKANMEELVVKLIKD